MLVRAQSGRRHPCEQIESLRRQVRPDLLLCALDNEDPELVGHEHEVILDGVRGDGPGAAERVMRDHVLENGRHIVGALELAARRSAREEAAPEESWLGRQRVTLFSGDS